MALTVCGALILVDLAACSPSSPTGVSRSQTPSGSPGPSPSNPYQQRFSDAALCPVAAAPDVPEGSGCVSSLVADLNGDGSPDRFVVFARLAHRVPVSWWAEALVGDTVTLPYRLPFGQGVFGNPTTYPRVVGAADANGDGRAEVFVMLSADLFHSGAQPIDGIFAVRGKRIEPVTAGGRTFLFRTNGISRYGQGAVCGTQDGVATLTVGRVEQVPGAWAWTEHTYTWRGLRLSPGSRRAGRLPADLVINDPRVWHFYQLLCGSLHTF
jgi:hypothetical protein